MLDNSIIKYQKLLFLVKVFNHKNIIIINKYELAIINTKSLLHEVI